MSDSLTVEQSEFYPTPNWTVWRILEAIELPLGHWLDPCVGEGAIPAAVEGMLTDVTREWWGIDIRKVADADQTTDYLLPTLRARFDVCLMNPPFSKALAFAQIALSHCEHVVMLQRLNWLQGPKERANWLRDNPPGVYVLPDRPSFSGDGKTDGGGYAWFVWPPQHATVLILASTPRSEIDEARYPSLKRQTAFNFDVEGVPM